MAERAAKSSEIYIVKVGEAEPPSLGPTYNSVYSTGLPTAPEDVQSCWDIFSQSVKKFPNNKFLGRRKIVDGKAGEYVWETYQEVMTKVLSIGAAMRDVGVHPKERCGVYGTNSPEWYTTMQACNAHSISCVPLYDTLGEDAVEFILKHSEASIVFVQDLKVPPLLNALTKGNHAIKTLVCFSTFTAEQTATISEKCHGIKAYSWAEFLELGAAKPAELSLPKRHDICTIMYTSGTTGEPKGVVISHESVVDEVVATKYSLEYCKCPIDDKDLYMSYLPLAHIFDRCAEESFTYVGAGIGYWQGNAQLLMDDMKALQPTLIIGVPRIYDRIYSGFHKKIGESGWLTRTIFNYGYKTKLNNMMQGYTQDKASPLFDRLIFNKVKQSMGGRVKVVISGGAPLADHVEEFCRTALCCPVIQGYGLTESLAGTFIAVPNVMSMKGTVGTPLPNVSVRLKSVPEMNYDALGTPERGEICLKSVAVFTGYYKNRELTEEALIDGWLHTGDIGEWQPDGAMKIIDRKKNIFKLSQGEYVAVEKLETVYESSTIVDTIWVYGNSFKSCLIAVVIPTQTQLEAWAESEGIDGDYETICQNPKAKEYVLKELAATQKSNKLKGFEAVKGVHLETEQFTFENDLITPTYKKKRQQLLKKYQTVIDEMYKGLK